MSVYNEKLDRILEIVKIDTDDMDLSKIDNELEVLYSDLYERIHELQINRYYFEDKLRDAIMHARIAIGLDADPSMRADVAKRHAVTAVLFLKNRF